MTRKSDASLLKAGWIREPQEAGTNTQQPQYRYYHPSDKVRNRGGYGLISALDILREDELIAKNGGFYIAISDHHGFGYHIRVRESNNRNEYQYRNLDQFRNIATKEHAAAIVEALNDGTAIRYIKDPPRYSEPKIIKIKEHHGDPIYLVHSYDEFCKLCLVKIKERKKDGYYDFVVKKPVEPAFTVESTVDMPNGPIKQAILQEWKNYNLEVQEVKESARSKEELKMILAGEIRYAPAWLIKNSPSNEIEILDPCPF